MILIVGLGNPGKKYEKTRHNLGFRVVNEFAKENNFPDFKLKKKFLAEIKEGKIAGEKIILAKPQTFMNNSGQSVRLLTRSYKLEPNNLIIVHDDIDLTLGKIKIIKNRGSAGHKGVQSIIDKLGTKNFVRFRIGIQPTTYNLQLKTFEDFVLQKLNKEEEKILKEVIGRTCQAMETAIKEGIEKAMNKFNQ
jgi:PTH1 family peptidyl-tRNA hydrolase